ncbi:MAG: RES family NAD+ phosphorylase [Methylomonas sp.]
MADLLRHCGLMRIFRIADERHPIWDGFGAALVGGRWNSIGHQVIYGSLSYACAMLEMLAHTNIGRIPDTHQFVTVDIPSDVTVEQHGPDTLPDGWDLENSSSAKAFGDLWLKEARSAVLLVPSVIAKLEWNALVNPKHSDAAKLVVSDPEKVAWDGRLFKMKLL